MRSIDLLCVLVVLLTETALSFVSAADDEFESVQAPLDQRVAALPFSDDLERRRLQFTTTTSGPPTEEPSLPPTPNGADLLLNIDDTVPYILVDFNGSHISWESANTFCKEQVGTHLASVDKSKQERINQTAQMDLMIDMCQDSPHHAGTAEHADCWIGLKYSPDTTLFEWENGQSLEPSVDRGFGVSETGWRSGASTPTAFTYLSGETTVRHL